MRLPVDLKRSRQHYSDQFLIDQLQEEAERLREENRQLREGLVDDPESGLHKLKLTIEEGSVYASLICPESACEPANCCGKCSRRYDDEDDTERCYDCPEPGATPAKCWLDGWDDLAEYLTGKVEVTVDIDAKWNGDHPVLTIASPAVRGREAGRAG